MHALLWMIPVFPLLSATILALFGTRLSRRVVALMGTGSVGLSSFVAILIAIGFLTSTPASHSWVQTLWTWMNVDGFRPEIAFYYDPVTLIMTLVITFVGFLIHLYSVDYM